MKLRSSVSLAAISLFFISSVWAQMGPPQGSRGGMQQEQGRQQDPVARLNRALESAGAPALNQSQQNELTTLVNNFRSAHPWGTPDQAMVSAKTDLEKAILSRDEAAVDSAANALASHISERASTMIRDSARLEIQVLSILSDQQVTALRNQFGNSGILMTLGSLTGPRFRGGFGGGMQRRWK